MFEWANIASFAEDIDLVDPVHNGSLLTADFGTNHDQTVPEVWEYAGDYVQAHAQANPPTIPGPIDRAFGAFTVKNENNTDGDLLVDNYVGELDDSLSENNVIATGTNNRDEVDLIKFDIKLPKNLSALKTITLSSHGSGDNPCVVFWKHKTKTEKYGDGTQVKLNSGTEGQKVTVWGEMPSQSPAIAGWHVKCSYVEKLNLTKASPILVKEYDKIAVTSIWAESAGSRSGRHEIQIVNKLSPLEIVVPWIGGIRMNPGDWVVIYDDHNAPGPAVSDTATQCVMLRVADAYPEPQTGDFACVEFDSPLPAWVDPNDSFTDGLIAETDEPDTIEAFTDRSSFCHIGIARDRPHPRWGNELVFRPLPYGIAVTKMSNGKLPKFDITQQLFGRIRITNSIGLSPRQPKGGPDWPKGDEEANDDAAVRIDPDTGQVVPYWDPVKGDTGDQDCDPRYASDRFVYVDQVGRGGGPDAIIVRYEQRGNFRTFCRVRLDGVWPGEFDIDGSRCSAKLNWHVVVDVVPEAEAGGA